MRFQELKGIKCKKLFFVILPLLLASCTAENEQQMVQRAKEYLTQKKVGYAAIELKNILQANPQNAEARYLLGKVNMEAGDFASAKKEFQRAIEAGGSPEEATIGKMQAMLALREYKEIIDDKTSSDGWSTTAQANMLALKAAAALAEGDSLQAKNLLVAAENIDAKAHEVLKTAIQLQMVDKQYVDAGATLSKALELYPDDSALLMLKAELAVQEKDIAAAITICQQIIDSNSGKIMSPDTRQAHLCILKLAIIQNNFELAHKSRDALLTRNSGDPEALYFAAVVAFEEKEFDRAKEYLEKILNVASGHAPTLLLSGAVNYAKQDYEQAAYYLTKYLAIDPENNKARKMLGRAYMALGQHNDAQAEFNSALNENADDAELIALLGISEISGGQVQSGIAELEKALAMAPGSRSLKLQLAKAYIDVGQTDSAIKQLDEVLQTGGDNYQVSFIKVQAYLRSQNFEMAMNTAQKMLSESPDNPDVLTLMGIIQLADKDKAAARKYFTQALNVNADHTGSEINLARLDEQQGDIASAEKRYLSVHDKKPENITAMTSLARLAAQKSDVENQIKWLEAARQVDKKELFSRVQLVEIYLNKENVADAEVLIRELEEVYPTAPGVLMLKGKLLMAQKRFTQAEAVISKVIDARPELETGYYLQAQNQLALGNNMAALESAKKAYMLKPDVLRNVILLASIEQSVGNYNSALKLGGEVVDAATDSAVGYIIKGDAMLAMKKYQPALVNFDKAWTITKSRDIALRRFKAKHLLSSVTEAAPILAGWLEQQPDDKGVLLELATAYLIDKQNKNAAINFEKVLLLQPDNVVALNNLAWMYGQENNPRALELAEKAYSLQSESPGIIDTYGWVLLKNNKTAEALIMLKQAAKKLPDVPEVQYHYAKALFNSGDTDAAGAILKPLIKSGKDFDGRADAEKMLRQ